jgi:MFS family permease
MDASLAWVLIGTFTLRFSTGLTGALLVYYLAELPKHGGEAVDPRVVGILAALFFVAELVLSPVFGVISDRIGQRPVMQLGPVFGGVAVTLTGLTTSIPVLGFTRLLEGSSTAASVPSILGYVARATTDDEGLRGRAVARFELATLAGLGIGLVAAGPLWELLGPIAFFLNTLIYGGSWTIYRFGVRELREVASEAGAPAAGAPDDRALPGEHYSPRRYWRVVTSSQVWLLAPTWIAVNAAIGLWSSQTIFQLVKSPDPNFSDQRLMGGFSPVAVSVGFAVGLLVFFAGLLYWGGRFKNMRRTTIIFCGVGGGALAIAAAFAFNHAATSGPLLQGVLVFVAGLGLFVLAGATPAALGLLADISESYPLDRGAIMGLYSVFLAIGQIAGSLIGGEAAHRNGIDGMFAATLVLLALALVPLFRLRSYEHLVGTAAPAIAGAGRDAGSAGP